MSKNLIIKRTVSPNHNIHKYSWLSPALIERRQQSRILDEQSFRGTDCDTDCYLSAYFDICNMRKNYLCLLLNIQGVNNVRQS
jgi:hypothetical protein